VSAAVAITAELLRGMPLPEPGDSKRDRGQVLVIGGALATPGAVLLTGLAALRVGAGVLSMAVPEEVVPAMAVAVPEASVTGWRVKKPDWSVLDAVLERTHAVVIGPGLDDPEIAASAVEYVAQCDASSGPAPVLLDAYALGVLGDIPAAADALAGRVLLTPNGKEAQRLLGTDDGNAAHDAGTAAADDATADRSDEQLARAVATRWNATVSCENVVATPKADTVHRAVGGNPGLGTSGSGDVLAGAVAGLLARGADATTAACWGTYLHCASGDRLAERLGPLGYLARELLDELTPAMTAVTRP
jgi:hydroxyethylthiazole kinase-like uncharacterized protein yjeF